jgi:hypothetical protein
MKKDIKSAHTLFIVIGTVFWIATSPLLFLGYEVIFFVFSGLAIVCYVIAVICFYHKPKRDPNKIRIRWID